MSGITLGCFSIGYNIGDLPTWFQAIGSVGAVIVAIWMSRRQSKESERLAARQHHESLKLLDEQHRQTVSRDKAAYHRSVADRIIPVTALIEHWENIASGTLEIARGHPFNDEFQRIRKKVRGVEATQVDDAIKRIDAQQIPEILLVNEFIRMRHLSALMVNHVRVIKSSGRDHDAVKKAVDALLVNHSRVEDILRNFQRRRDFHLEEAG